MDKEIPCCLKPGTLSNKCLISAMETPVLLPLFVCLQIWTALFTKVGNLEALEGWRLILFHRD